MTNLESPRIILPVAGTGAWCNGNTWVSKTFVEGSNPSAPAAKESLETVAFQGSFLRTAKSLQMQQLIKAGLLQNFSDNIIDSGQRNAVFTLLVHHKHHTESGR